MVLSDLQIALIGAGAIAVAAVWVYNLWQERKLHRLSQTFFTHPQDDALITPASEGAAGQPAGDVQMHEMPDIRERKEPTFEPAISRFDDAELQKNSVDEFSEAIHYHSEAQKIEVLSAELNKTPPDAPSAAEPAARVASDREPGVLSAEWADPLTHCVLHLKTTEPASAPTLWMLQSGLALQAGKPLRWWAHDDLSSNWLEIDENATGRHSHWVAALQLADRRGAVSESALVHFFDGMQQLARHIDADLTLPDLAQVAAHATALDAFCADVDIQFKVHIVESAGGVFSGTKLRGIAEAAGMQLEEDGCFHARDGAGEELFTLMNLGSEPFTLDNLRSLVTHGLSLSLDVPRVSDGPATFARMLTTGQQLARALDGVLVDAQRVPLTDVMTSAIRAKITELQQAMHEADIVPGSTRAQRLFS